MAKINLLPWREELREAQQKVFINVLAFSVLFTCFAFGGVYQYIEEQKDYQTTRNNYLEEEIKEVEKEIAEIEKIDSEKERLRNKIEGIESLQASRSEIVHVFDELRRITPEGIYLTDFIQHGKLLTIKGRLTANSEASALMDAIEESDWLMLDGTGFDEIDGRARSEKEKDSKFVILAKQKVQKNTETDKEAK